MRSQSSLKSRYTVRAAAVICATVTLCSCGSTASDFSRREDYSHTEYKYTGMVETSAPAGEDTPEEAVPASAETETAAVTTTAPPETTTEATTTAAPPKPVGLQKAALEGHSYSIDKFPHKVYSNTKVKKALGKIDDICADYGYKISFAYKSMDSGTVIRYNADTRYGICSTVKAPFCKNLLAQGTDMDDKVNISVIWSNDGGKVAQGGTGKTYTARELVRLAITESDNSAYYNLINKYGYGSFNQMNYDLGVGYDLGASWIFNYGTANDLLKQYEDIYKYAEKSDRGKWLIKLMTKTDLETQITAQLKDKYTVAHKYGSDWDQNCYHDCAICYAEHPFVLVIMTDQVPETEQSNKVFKKLAKQFDIINDQLVVE